MLQYLPIASVTVAASFPPGPPPAPALRRSPRRIQPGWRIDLPPRRMFCGPEMRHERDTRLPVSVWIQLDFGLVEEDADERDMFGRPVRSKPPKADSYCCCDDVITLAQQLGL